MTFCEMAQKFIDRLGKFQQNVTTIFIEYLKYILQKNRNRFDTTKLTIHIEIL